MIKERADFGRCEAAIEQLSHAQHNLVAKIFEYA